MVRGEGDYRVCDVADEKARAKKKDDVAKARAKKKDDVANGDNEATGKKKSKGFFLFRPFRALRAAYSQP